VVLGCPHVSLQEVKKISELLDGKKIKNGMRLWVQTVPEVKAMAQRMGYLDIIEKAGGNVLNNACAVMLVHERKTQSSMPSEVKTIATDQVKAAYFAPAQYDWGLWYGSVEQCINAAIEGRFVR